MTALEWVAATWMALWLAGAAWTILAPLPGEARVKPIQKNVDKETEKEPT